jgi:hypothetical protein
LNVTGTCEHDLDDTERLTLIISCEQVPKSGGCIISRTPSTPVARQRLQSLLSTSVDASSQSRPGRSFYSTLFLIPILTRIKLTAVSTI